VSALLAIALVWQPARSLFHFGRLHWDDLAVCAAVGAVSLVVLESLKSKWFHLAAAPIAPVPPKP
jgi:P-type Ca2+ transporter type 2C